MNAPLRTIGTPGDADHLLVMLPGMVMRAEAIFEAGFADAIARRALPLDLLAVDVSGIGLDASSTWNALQNDILAPERARRKSVWLGGISLGGLVAMSHVATRPGTVDGLCLLAPYPGSRPSVNVMDRAGGPDRWTPSEDDLRDPELRVWQWLQRPPPELPVFIGHGRDDRFADRIQRVADRFPVAARHTAAGGHDWAAWLPLWEHFLEFWNTPRVAFGASPLGGGRHLRPGEAGSSASLDDSPSGVAGRASEN